MIIFLVMCLAVLGWVVARNKREINRLNNLNDDLQAELDRILKANTHTIITTHKEPLRLNAVVTFDRGEVQMLKDLYNNEWEDRVRIMLAREMTDKIKNLITIEQSNDLCWQTTAIKGSLMIIEG